MLRIKLLVLLIFTTASFALDDIDYRLNSILNNKNTSLDSFKTAIQLIKVKQEKLEKNTFEYLFQAKAFIDEGKFIESNGDFFLLICKYWKENNEFHLSEEYINKAITFFEENHNPFDVVIAYLSLAELKRAESKLQEALTIIGKSESLIKNDNQYLLAKAENRRAAVLFQLKYKVSKDSINLVIDQTINSSNKSLRIAKSINNYDLIINNYNILGSIVKARDNFNLALRYYDSAFVIMDKFPDSSFTLYQYPTVNWNLARTYSELGNIKKTIELGLHGLEYSKKTGIFFQDFALYELLANHYEKIGDLKTALEYQRKLYLEYYNFVIQNKSKVALDIQTKYETVEKEKEIERNQIRIRYQLLVSLVIILGILTALIILYRKNKAKKEQNRIIREKNEELAKLNETKDKFFSIIAHDLKNPLSSMINSADMLANSYDEFNDIEKIEISMDLHESSERLMKLLENLLTWSSSQRGLINVHLDEVGLNTLFSNNISLCNNLANKKSIALLDDLKEDISFRSDLNIISTILRNLTTNAIKFTPFGGIIRFHGFITDSKTNPEVIISVKDNGIGINQDKIDSLFQVGKNKSTDGTNMEKGTGLGLILCKEFIDKLGGKIWVESQPGKGSTFLFSIPYKK
jgi:signal transduction histidine kinase